MISHGARILKDGYMVQQSPQKKVIKKYEQRVHLNEEGSIGSVGSEKSLG